MTGQILPFAWMCLQGWGKKINWEMVILWTSLHQPLLACLTKHSEDEKG